MGRSPCRSPVSFTKRCLLISYLLYPAIAENIHSLIIKKGVIMNEYFMELVVKSASIVGQNIKPTLIIKKGVIMNEYFMELAVKSASIVGQNIKPIWIYCQWAHETADFTSQLCIENKNLGGLCGIEVNELPQPDGDLYYLNFETYEDFAEYFGKYLKLYSYDGIYSAFTMDEYVNVLKCGGYFGDTVENYLEGMKYYEKQI